MGRILWKTVAFALVAALAMTGTAYAQESEEEKPKNWSNKTDLGIASTTGNSENTNVAFANNYEHTWTRSVLNFDLAAIRNETTTRTVSNPGTGSLVINETSDVTAETYAAALGYRREITGRLYWFVDGSWFRNTPAGIDDRLRAGAGIGYGFIDGEKHKLRGEVGLNYTDESQTSGVSLDFTGGRAMLDYSFQITDSATLESAATYFGDFDDSDNWQANWITSLTMSMTKTVAMKFGYTMIYDNQPAIVLVAPDPTAPPGSLPLPFEADTTDTIFTASVVLNF
jgi:putative salt-induced outer membrane protein YdiY